MAKASRMQALEWRIAWRHLRAGERYPRWVDSVAAVSLFLLAIGFGFVVWAAQLGPTPEPGEQLFSAVATPQQRYFGVFGGLSIAIGAMLLVLAAVARFFNLLATIITMSVLLGCMALVVVLSLMSGLEVDLRDKILNQKAHLRISAASGNRFTDYEALTEALAGLPEVAGASPYLEAEIMVRSGINRQGAVLLGVQPERLLHVSNVAELVHEGSFDALSDPASIPDLDPFALAGAETPWRLRHLDGDKDRDRDRDRARSKTRGKDEAMPRPKSAREREVDAAMDRDLEPKGPSDAKRDSDAGVGAGTSLGLPPPPAELFGPLPRELGPSDRFDAGDRFEAGDRFDSGDWEDPVEVLGLGSGSPEPPTPPGANKPRANQPGAAPPERIEPYPPARALLDGLPPPPKFEPRDDWSDDGWEDPVEVLGLPPESGEDGAEAKDPGKGSGEDDSLVSEEGVVDPILLGRELANELGVGLGTRVQLITPVGRLTPAGRVPGILAAKVGGVFHSGMYEYDRKNVYTPLPVAQAFLRTGDRVSGIEVKLHDIDELEAGQQAVEAALRQLGRSSTPLERTLARLLATVEDDGVRAELAARVGVEDGEPELIVESWKELNRNLFSAMFLEKIAMFVALLFVVLVASFGILASNLMSVLEKSKEIAILKAMGSPDALIQRVFVAEGLCLGLLGAIGGISVGLALCWALDRFGFPFNENVYYIERLPVVINPVEVAVVGVAALFIVYLSSLYPARVASRMRPVDGLRQQDK